MKKPLRISLYLLGGLFVVFIGLIIALSILVDADDIKAQVSESVSQQTGRDFIIGDAGLRFFPWLGVNLSTVELGNAKGFGETPMAQLDSLELHVKLKPLLSGDVQLANVVVDGLKLDLQRNKQGVTNWDDLLDTAAKKTEKPAAEKPTSTEKEPFVKVLSVAGIDFSNASVHWRDAQAKQEFRLSNLDLNTGAIEQGKPFTLDGKLDFTSTSPKATGHISLKSEINFQPEQQTLSLKNLDLTETVNADFLPGKKLESRFSTQHLVLDLRKQTLAVNKFSFTTLGVKLHGNLSAEKLFDQLQYHGDIKIDPFSPRQVSKTLAIALPEMADATALTKTTLAFKLNGTASSLKLDQLKLGLDETTMTGYVNVLEFSKPTVRYQFDVNNIDIDRYLPPPTKETAAKKPAAQKPATKQSASKKPAAGGEQAVTLPLEPLRKLDLQGTIKIGRLKASNLRSTKISIPATAKNGHIRLAPLHADMYDGHYQGNLGLDVTGSVPRISMNEHLQAVQVGPLLKDYWGDDKIRGRADLSAKLTARGTDPLAIRKTLSGKANFSFKDGVVKGINIPAEEAKLKAILKGQPAPKTDGPQETGFSSITGSIDAVNGLLTNKDLRMAMPHARAAGAGKIFLVNEKIDYTLSVKFSSKAVGQKGQTYDQMDRVALPIYVRGTLSQPEIKVDYSKAVKELARRELEKQKKKVKEKTKKELKEEEEKLKQKIEDKLEKLFKR